MKHIIIIGVQVLLLLISACGTMNDKATIYDMTVNYMSTPLGIDVAESQVVFGWKTMSEEKGWRQSAYQIKVYREDYEKDNQCVWDSEKIISDDCTGIIYLGDNLSSRTKYVWRLIVWDRDDNQISSESFFETGLINGDWDNAEWIYAPKKYEFINNQVLDYSIDFTLSIDEIGAGFAFGAPQMEYGTYYILKSENEESNLHLELYKNDLLLWEQFVEETADERGREREYSLTVSSGHAMEVSVDDEKIGDISLPEDVPLGSYGLFVPKGFYTASFDSIEIRNDKDETIIAHEEFSDEKNIFTPYYLKVKGGKCQAKSGFTFIPGNETPAPMFRKEFETEGQEISVARLYIASKGIYHVNINGNPVNDDYMGAGQSNYTEELFYRTYDVTSNLIKGQNCIGAMLGHGRYDRAGHDFGDNIELKAVLFIKYKDGTEQSVSTDNSWKYFADGPVRNDDIYMGEYYDSNYEIGAWDRFGFDDSEWQDVEIDEDNTPMRAASTEPVRVIEYISPILITEPEDETFVCDFGQNINGICCLSFDGEENQLVTMRFSELLNSDGLEHPDDIEGTIYTSNLIRADNTDYYLCRGNGKVTYAPIFSYRGFRYMQITGLTRDQLKTAEIKACVISTDLVRTGSFECSDERLNKLYESIVWTQIDNYVDFPTDCPQRDERFGWTGDAQVFASTAIYNYDCHSFLNNYIRLLVEEQNSNGSYPQIVLQSNGTPVNGWSDAPIILTWEMYQQYGDVIILNENLQSMSQYVDCLVEDSEHFLRTAYGYGDHNAIVGTDITLLNTAQCSYVSGLLAKMYNAVGDKTGYNKYTEIEQAFQNAWRNKYINDDGSVGNWAPSEFLVGLAYDIYPEDLKQQGADKLNFVLGLESFSFHPKTGYVTTPHILDTLSEYGYGETAYRLLTQETAPSWLYLISNGATTMPETLTALDENENGKKDVYVSLNHCGFGSVGKWFYTGILGIQRDDDSPGFKHFYLKPQISECLSYAKGSYESIRGAIVSEWEKQDEGVYKYHCKIPANTEATVVIPHEISNGEGEIEYDIYDVESGEYDFYINVMR